MEILRAENISKVYRQNTVSLQALRNVPLTVQNGRWAQKENEVVFTKNYVEKNKLKPGAPASVDLTVTDAEYGRCAILLDGA